MLKAVAIVLLMPSLCAAANFRVFCHDRALGTAIATAAERLRDDLSYTWFGERMPEWPEPCIVQVDNSPAERGSTTYKMNRGVPTQMLMSISGPPYRIMDSILPHEILHTVFASHLGVIPRWANEGACSNIEALDSRNELRHNGFRRVMPLATLFRLDEYPRDMTQFYAQSDVICDFLLEHGGKRNFTAWLQAGTESKSQTGRPEFTRVLFQHYGYANDTDLEAAWLDWVRAGAPRNTMAGKRWVAGSGWVGGIDQIFADSVEMELFSRPSRGKRIHRF